MNKNLRIITCFLFSFLCSISRVCATKSKGIIIRANNITIDSSPKLPEVRKNARDLVKKLIRIDDEHVQYVKAEQNDSLIPADIHPFVKAVHIAYSLHLPLVISPDMIWYLISSGIARHINANAEQLRKKFVDHDGKKTIDIRRDDFIMGSLDNPWNEVVDEFCSKIKNLIKNEVSDTMQANFSTTSNDSRVVSQIVLMDAMQKYFDYRLNTMCGIPEIRVTGTKDDWVRVSEKTNKIVGIVPELKRWMDSGLSEILENFIDIFDDKINKDFWNQIYKVNGGSGGPYITGWIIALFPYVNQNHENSYVWNNNTTWRKCTNGGFLAGLTTASFTYHMNQMPFTWEYYKQELKMLFVGGLIGVSVDNSSENALKPIFGYAVAENKIKTNKSA